MVRFLVSCSAFALCLTTTQVQAQTVEGSQVTDAEGDGGLAEIIVTAQRRSESVQKSSLSIQVASAEDLQRAGVTSARDLATVVPNVQVTQAGPYVQTYIRGVGDYSANGLAQLAVSYNIDGVNIDRATAISPNFYDLERVEVLKGPQGTLYGRNATGGAVNRSCPGAWCRF